jgi:MSHA pilin protein MshA
MWLNALRQGDGTWPAPHRHWNADVAHRHTQDQAGTDMQRLTHSGFALIEQIAAILAIGTASAVALPQLADLQTEAEGVALQHLAGTASTAMLVNQGGCLVTGHRAEPGRCRPVQDCADVGTLLHGGLPEGYEVQAQSLPRGAEGRCRLVHPTNGGSTNFTGLGAGN